jgi:hypothetical protein
MLAAYLTQTRSLLQLPGTNSSSLYSDGDLTRFINVSRGQVAGEAECIRRIGTIPTVQNVNVYPFSSIVLNSSGVDGVLNVRSIRYAAGQGSIWIPSRAWEWFELYELNNAAPNQAAPMSWSQYGQGASPGATGSSGSGSLYISPLPDIVYTLNCDCVCYPVALASDGDPEVIPYLFTDCVPYFAAYYALLSAQTNARLNDAIQYFKIYSEFLDRARKAANPSVLRWQFEKAQDPVQASKLGQKGAA